MSQQDDDRLFSFYNQELLSLSSAVDLPRRLAAPQLTAHAVSPICGSEIDVDLMVDDTGRVTAFGYAVEACALTKAVVAVMSQAIMNKTRGDIVAAGRELSQMLEGLPVSPTKDWARLGVLAPVKDYKARHNAILLPFEAVEKAFKNSGQ